MRATATQKASEPAAFQPGVVVAADSGQERDLFPADKGTAIAKWAAPAELLHAADLTVDAPQGAAALLRTLV